MSNKYLPFKTHLDNTSKKYNCPQCGKKTFVAQVYADTKKPVDETIYGRCDRQEKCKYQAMGKTDTTSSFFTAPPPTVYGKFSGQTYKRYHGGYERNNFVQYLKGFDCLAENLEHVLKMYYIGTLPDGATCLPYIDNENILRAVQTKNFGSDGHTKKNGNSFLHAHREVKDEAWVADYKRSDIKVSCFFGEHLLQKFPKATVNIVEAGKTCIVASAYFGDIENNIWLGAYSLIGLKKYKYKCLVDREINLYPDYSKNAIDMWTADAEKISIYCNSLVNVMIDEYTGVEGSDLADKILKENTHQRVGGVGG